MPNLHHPVSLQDLEGEVAEDILHVYLHVLGLPQTEVRVCVAVVPREAAQVGPNKGAEKSVVPISVGLGWVGLGWVGLGWVGLGWVGLGWVGLAWVGLGWAGLGWAGLCCVVLG